MEVSVRPGRYIVAVSGGVDSMALLDVLRKQSGLDLVVAHFDHGIRKDSGTDRQLVEATATRYGLPFVYAEGKLGPAVSEAQARQARYAFLYKVQADNRAEAIITAHHQDDSIETALINILRGTGRKGLSSLQSTQEVQRPFLEMSKQTIYDYVHEQAKQGNVITWHEDSTNSSDRYLRNYLRHHIMDKLDAADREALLGHIAKANALNAQIDELLLGDMSNSQQFDRLNRYRFIMLPYDVSCEVMAAWLRQNGLREFDRKGIARLVVAAKAAFPGKRADINAGYFLKTDRTALRITR